MKDSPGFPETLEDQLPLFPETDAPFQQMGNYPAADIKKWASNNDPVGALIRGGGSEAAINSGGTIDGECENPLDLLTVAVVFGNLGKQSGRVSVEEAFEAMGLTRETVVKTSFQDTRMKDIAHRLLTLFESDEKAIHPRALSFAIDFLNDYAEYTRSARPMGASKEAAVRIGGKEWSRENALDVYFDKSVFVMAPDLETTPIEHFFDIANAGDDSTPGAAHIFDVLVRHFGIVLAPGFKRVPTLRVATKLLEACSKMKRAPNTPGGFVVRALDSSLRDMYPQFGARKEDEYDKLVVHWFINPLFAAAGEYQTKWKPDTDWLTHNEVRNIIQ